MKLTKQEAQRMMNKFGGSLDIEGTNISELPDNLTVGGYLYLRGTNISELPDNLTVGGYLDIEGTNISELPDNLTVGGSLDIRGTNISELPDNLTVGGYLDIEGTNISELPDNLTVGGSLYLRGTNISELPDNLTVGGYLYLRGTNISELPDNLTVGGYLDIRGTNISELQRNKVNKLTVGYCKKGGYIYCDGILTHVKKKKRLFDKYDYFIGKIKNKNVIFDGVYYAHCKDVKTGVSDLNFKHATNRGADQYKNLKLTDVLSINEAKTMYRVLTGACKQGTDNFVESLGNKAKDKYSIQEMIDLTKGEYNSFALRQFFEI